MNLDQYQAACERTESLVFHLSKQQIRLVHGLLGCASEVGELADNLKRHLFYGQELDTNNLSEEIGDVLWYLSLLANATGQSLQSAAEANIRKLQTRFPEKFTEYHAAEENRDREAEAACMSGIDPASGESQTMFSIRCPQCGDFCENFGPIYNDCNCGYTWGRSSNNDNPSDIEDELRCEEDMIEKLQQFAQVAVDLLDGQDNKRMQAELNEILKGVN